MSGLSVLVDWIARTVEVRLAAGLLFLIPCGLLFFRFTRGAGKLIFFLLSLGFIGLSLAVPASILFAPVLLIILLVLTLRGRESAPQPYQAALATVEGGGIKRGLTAAEAAVIMDLPLKNVLAIVIIGLLKKGILVQTPNQPLTVVLSEPYILRNRSRDLRSVAMDRRMVAQNQNVVLHSYEEPFLQHIEAHRGEPLRETNFAPPLKTFIRHVARRIQGFNLPETKAYYQQHLGRARHDVALTDHDLTSQRVRHHHLEWLFLDEEFATLYEGYDFSEFDKGKKTASQIQSWTQQIVEETAAAIPPKSLQIRDAHGSRIVLGGEDSISEAFFEAILKT
jgi:hypothetical protein